MGETKKPTAEDYVIRTGELKPAEIYSFTHPLNPNSAISFVPLSDRVGMQRAQLGLGRIPPGRESFVPHSHSAQEEFVFILEGNGEMEIDGERVAVGPGDYVGFPRGSPALQYRRCRPSVSDGWRAHTDGHVALPDDWEDRCLGRGNHALH